ncbi:hypothetical protein ACQUFY_05770 [Robbsia andropogonis]|uniref:hypothetical protein n=1 Tax=Robbsia andropogonis TaxID=28092 RepID=UPI003D25CA6E
MSSGQSTKVLIKTFYSQDKLIKAAVVRDVDYAEYQVIFSRDGLLNPAATYHTDDYRDARGTALLMVKDGVTNT